MPHKEMVRAKLTCEKVISENLRFEYLAYSKSCAVSAVTGGLTEEMNGIPIPAQLLYEEPSPIERQRPKGDQKHDYL